jgi:hypothetical protein
VRHRAVLRADEAAALLHGLVVLGERGHRRPHAHHQLDAQFGELPLHRRRVRPLRRVELPLAQVRPVEEVADDDVDRQAAALVLPCDGEEFVLSAVAQLALPEAGGPLGKHRRAAGGGAVSALGVGRVARGDPVVDLPGRVRHPARAVSRELDAADGRAVPQEGVAAAGGEDRDGHLGVALHQVEDGVLLGEQPVLVLPEAEQLLALVRGEALLQAVVAVADRGVEARARPPEVGALLGEEFGAVVGADEADQALGADLDGQCADGQPPVPVLDLDSGLGGGRLVE